MELPEYPNQAAFENDVNSSSWRASLSWIISGFWLPCFRLRFYQKAIQKRLAAAFGFFLMFGLVTALFSTVSVWRNLRFVNQGIQEAFASGELPEIVIQDGIAFVDAPQPVVLLDDEGTIFIIDTTGTTKEIDRSRYYQGMLLTQDTIAVLSEGEYQELQLSELHQMFEMNPIQIDASSMVSLWENASSIIAVLAFFGLLVWNIAFRFMFLTFLAVIVWGLASAFKSKLDYGPVLILGIFALVPATYLNFILRAVDVRFFLLKTILLLFIWVFVLAKTSQEAFNQDDIDLLDGLSETLPKSVSEVAYDSQHKLDTEY